MLPGRQQLASFLDALFLDGDLVELRPIETWEDKPTGRREARMLGREYKYPIQIVEDYDRLLRLNMQERANVFFGVCPRVGMGGTKDHVRFVRCLWADLDNCTPAEAHHRIEQAEFVTPTICVSSGTGVHLYWRLAEAFEIRTEADRRRVEQATVAIAEALQGDHVQDVARILRLPGFANVKDVRNGQPPTYCTLHMVNDVRYDLGEIEEYLPTEAIQVATATTESPADSGQPVTPQAAGRAIASLYEPAEDRSARDLRVVCELIESGAGRDAIWNLVRDTSKFAERGERYFDSTYKAAAGRFRLGGDRLKTPAMWRMIGEVMADPDYGCGLEPISTTYPELDEALGGGLRPQMTYVLAGRTGSGKSMLALNIATRASLGRPTLICKLEESLTEAAWRIHAMSAQQPLADLLDGRASGAAFDAAALDLAEYQLRLSNERSLESIVNTIKLHAAQGGGLVVIDQLSMIQAGEGSVYELATYKSNRIREAALASDVPILVVAQLNRAGKNKGKADPVSAGDIAGSGSIEDDAAGVILIQGAELTGIDRSCYTMSVHTGKSRYGRGATGDAPIKLWWYPECCRVDAASYL
jgi:KaiC/GvpD/RAD55 family RecA-like ATPase